MQVHDLLKAHRKKRTAAQYSGWRGFDNIYVDAFFAWNGNLPDMPKINAERLISNLADLRKIGATGLGVVRPAFSEKDMEARNWLKSLYEDAGLEAQIDGIGNVLGRSRNSGPALLIGSHSDAGTRRTLTPTLWNA